MRRALIVAIVLAGCGGPSGTNLERSCRGEVVLDCDPHTYTVGTVASFEPSSIRPRDTMSSAQVHFEYDACDGSDAVTEVQVSAIYERSPGDERVVDLGIVLSDPDATGAMDAEITNPFALDVPGETDLTLRFVPVRDGCTGEAVEIEYRTGPTATTP